MTNGMESLWETGLNWPGWDLVLPNVCIANPSFPLEKPSSSHPDMQGKGRTGLNCSCYPPLSVALLSNHPEWFLWLFPFWAPPVEQKTSDFKFWGKVSKYHAVVSMERGDLVWITNVWHPNAAIQVSRGTLTFENRTDFPHSGSPFSVILSQC